LVVEFARQGWRGEAFNLDPDEWPSPGPSQALAEQIEELLQRLGVAARRAPHDPARAVIGDVGQVALPTPPRCLKAR
jgi:hypothetical protein